MSSTCDGCGKPIRWVTMTTGSRMPVEPSASGNIAILANGDGKVLGANERALTKSPLYVSHFANCPKAEVFRKKGRTLV